MVVVCVTLPLVATTPTVYVPAGVPGVPPPDVPPPPQAAIVSTAASSSSIPIFARQLSWAFRIPGMTKAIPGNASQNPNSTVPRARPIRDCCTWKVDVGLRVVTASVVLVAALPGVSCAGLKMHDIVVWSPVQLNVIGLLKVPDAGVSVIVNVAEFPADTVAEVTLVDCVKSSPMPDKSTLTGLEVPL